MEGRTAPRTEEVYFGRESFLRILAPLHFRDITMSGHRRGAHDVGHRGDGAQSTRRSESGTRSTALIGTRHDQTLSRQLLTAFQAAPTRARSRRAATILGLLDDPATSNP